MCYFFLFCTARMLLKYYKKISLIPFYGFIFHLTFFNFFSRFYYSLSYGSNLRMYHANAYELKEYFSFLLKNYTKNCCSILNKILERTVISCSIKNDAVVCKISLRFFTLCP